MLSHEDKMVSIFPGTLWDDSQMSHLVYVLQSHNAMAVLWTILSLFGFIDAIASSLIDYKACQKNFNCTSSLTPDDCPPGEFLDVQITNNCCHGCRVGIGSKTLNLIPSLTCIIKSAFFFSVSDLSRSRRKRLQSKEKMLARTRLRR